VKKTKEKKLNKTKPKPSRKPNSKNVQIQF